MGELCRKPDMSILQKEQSKVMLSGGIIPIQMPFLL